LECRVEYAIPPATYIRDDGNTGTIYKYLLSDGESITMEAVAFGVYGKKISQKLEVNITFLKPLTGIKAQ